MSHNVAGGWEISVRCPFFCRTEKQKHRIVCEGIGEDTRLNLVFLGSDRARVEHLREFCCREYTRCPMFHAANEKYKPTDRKVRG